MNEHTAILEKAKTLYPAWEKQAKQQVQQHIIQVFTRQIEGGIEPYTIEQYFSLRRDAVERTWHTVWKHTALQRFSKEERYTALEPMYKKEELATKTQVQERFIVLLQELLQWELDDWIRTFSSRLDREQLLSLAKKEHERKKTKQRFKELQKQVMEFSIDLLQREEFYPQAREHISFAFVRDISKYVKRIPADRNVSYYIPLKKGDPFLLADYPQFEDFLEEYTGEAGRWEWNELMYVTYYDRYYHMLVDFLLNIASAKVMRSINPLVLQEYRELAALYQQSGKEEQLFVDLHEIEEAVSDLASRLLDVLAHEETKQLLGLVIHTDKGKKLWDAYQRKVAVIEKRRRQEQELMESLFHDEFSFVKETDNTLYVLHVGPTNSGKTYHALQRLKKAETGVYMAPLRLLALEVYQTLNDNGAPCHLKTGEEERYTNGATITSCTIEVANVDQPYEVAVIDEAQMIADKERGFSWYRAITKTKAEEIHIILAPHALGVIQQLLTGKRVEMRTYTQSVPLVTETVPFQLKHARAGDAVVVFSRSRVLQTAAVLEQQGRRVSVIYGNMPPETRQAQMAEFLAGTTEIVVSTDAIGMGLNLPIRRIVFLETTKFDGTMRRNLTSQEIKQIAGRAGRKGMYETGYVAATENIGLVRQALLAKDEPIREFTIKPTGRMLKEYATISHDLTKFFEIWENFKAPSGMMKADLTQEQELYQDIRHTAIVERFSLPELYRYLSLPFSHYEKDLRQQWKLTLTAIVQNLELPEPDLADTTLEQLEQSYKKIGLHLLFLYSLDQRREAHMWERERQLVSQQIQSYLKTNLRAHTKSCNSCKKPLAFDYPYNICNACHRNRRTYRPKPGSIR